MTRLRTPKPIPPDHGRAAYVRTFVGLNRAMRRELAGADKRMASALAQVDRPVPRRTAKGKAAHRAQRVARKLLRRRLFRRVDEQNLRTQHLRKIMRDGIELEGRIKRMREVAAKRDGSGV